MTHGSWILVAALEYNLRGIAKLSLSEKLQFFFFFTNNRNFGWISSKKYLYYFLDARLSFATSFFHCTDFQMLHRINTDDSDKVYSEVELEEKRRILGANSS